MGSETSGGVEMKVKLKNTLTVTAYFWGDNSDITGKIIDVMEMSSCGNCMCITDKGLVDVHKEDIEEVIL